MSLMANGTNRRRIHRVLLLSSQVGIKTVKLHVNYVLFHLPLVEMLFVHSETTLEVLVHETFCFLGVFKRDDKNMNTTQKLSWMK